MARLLSILFVLLLSCADTDSLSKACDSPCYNGPENTVGVGTCKPGIWDCNTETCVGDIGPRIEVCDNHDTDCDGVIDNMPFGPVCGTDEGTCTLGREICIAGQWECTGVPPREEICDGLDNDCDGIPDNEVVEELCYDGEQLELIFGCSPGVISCSAGESYCRGQVLPSVELCDGIDNNCNGEVDEGFGDGVRSVDVILYIDRSTSMQDEMERLKTFLIGLAARLPRDNFRFAFINIPNPSEDSEVSIHSDFVSTWQAPSVVASILPNGGGREPSLDGPYLVATGQVPLSHRSQKTVHVIVTDEEAQSYLEPKLRPEDVREVLRYEELFFIDATSRHRDRDTFEGVYTESIRIENIGLLEERLKAMIDPCP